MSKKQIIEPRTEGSIYVQNDEDLGDIVKMLIRNEYKVQVTSDGMKYIVDFITIHADEYGCDDWMLVTGDEKEEIFTRRYSTDDDEE